MTVKHIENMDDYQSLLELSKTKLVVIDFSAEWCGPCKYIGPIFEKLSDEIDAVQFAKVDVDEAEDVAGVCGISAMPTFQFYRNGVKVDELMGADAAALQKENHAASVNVIVNACAMGWNAFEQTRSPVTRMPL